MDDLKLAGQGALLGKDPTAGVLFPCKKAGIGIPRFFDRLSPRVIRTQRLWTKNRTSKQIEFVALLVWS